MLRIEITHHLNQQGIDYFPAWFDRLFNAIKSIDGFIDIKYFLELNEFKACITLFFENNEKLNFWARSSLHHSIIGELDIYRTQPWEASRHLC